ncbi:UDP-2,3-diacylglucosamine diphosphatase LpxI [Myxococcota bacterium]|nr:UDP-2,3-diacylglucosamine diphosphatase LpxI [Myxococcota bacterium]
MSGRLGLIAGAGRLPLEIAQSVRDRSVLAIGYRGMTDPRLAEAVDELAWEPLGALGAQLDRLRRGGVSEVVLAGKVDRAQLLHAPDGLGLDDQALELLSLLKDKRDAHILGTLADWLEKKGVAVLSQAKTAQTLLPRAGVVGSVTVPEQQMDDVALAWRLGRLIADQGIGQCVCVSDGHVLAVEAIEGTDAAITRAGTLAPGGFVMVKRPGAQQDPRFDLPAIGPATIETLHRAGGNCVVVEAGATLMIDRLRMIQAADSLGIPILAKSPENEKGVE